MPNHHLHFLPKDVTGRVWERELHAGERHLAYASETKEGQCHFFLGSQVKIDPSITRDGLRDHTRTAWIYLRHLAPFIGVRTVQLQEDPILFGYVYETNDMTKWASESLIWHEDMKSLSEWETEIQGSWWKPSAGHGNVELHIAPGEGDTWFFMISGVHWAIDARGSLQTLDQYFEFLQESIRDNLISVDGLPWGTETQRLPPPMIEAFDQSKNTSSVPPPPVVDPQSTPPAFFTRSMKANEYTGHDTLTHSIKLSKTKTAAFRKICKSKTRTVTAAINSILILADVEATLIISKKLNEDAFKEAKQVLATSTLYPVAANAVDRRPLLSSKHADIHSPAGILGFAIDGFPTFYDMNNIRKCIQISDTGEITKLLTQETLWDGLAANSGELLKNGAKGTIVEATAFQNLLQAIPMGSVALPGGVASSTGDLDSLGLLSKWRPTSSSNSRLITVLELSIALRSPLPTSALCATCWQYDEEFTVHLTGCRKWQTGDEWELFVGLIRDNLEQVISGKEKCRTPIHTTCISIE